MEYETTNNKIQQVNFTYADKLAVVLCVSINLIVLFLIFYFL